MTDKLEEMYVQIAQKAQEGWDVDTQAVDLFNEHVMNVIDLASPKDFRLLDYDERVLVIRKILGNLLVAMYSVRLMTPSEEDLKDTAEAIDVTVANDALLCAALVSRGASDAFMYFHEADQVLNQSVVRSLGEALSGVFLLCNLLKVELLSLTLQL